MKWGIFLNISEKIFLENVENLSIAYLTVSNRSVSFYMCSNFFLKDCLKLPTSKLPDRISAVPEGALNKGRVALDVHRVDQPWGQVLPSQ